MDKTYTLELTSNQLEAIYESVCHMNSQIRLGIWGELYTKGQLKDLEAVEEYLWTML